MIKKIRYRLVWNRSGCLNQRGEGLVQIEAEQQGRKVYFSTHTYVLPEHFAHGCIINTQLADSLNYALFSMIREVEDVELEYIKKGVEVTLPILKEAVKAHRHTFATLLGQQGIDISVVSKLLGHQKLQTTEIYREVDRRNIEMAVSKVS